MCDSSWFVEVEGCGSSGFDVAEPAGAGACVAEDHDCGDAACPAFAHVWAAGFLADGVESVVVDDFFESLVAGSLWDFGAEPGWFSLGGGHVGARVVVEDHC